MISILSCTYRDDNLTLKFSELYKQLLEEKHQASVLLDLRSLPVSFLQENSIFGTSSEAVDKLLTTYIVEPEKYVFISPEYNGSFPGILKAFIDICEPKFFAGKKAALVGISTGRAGNLRGMDHLTDILHDLDVHVLPMKVPVSRVHTLVNENQEINDEPTIAALAKQIERFIQF
jgi:NAD(P)H-dependent FMN reductase